MAQFDKDYKKLIKRIMADGIEQVNERTGHKTKAIFGENIRVDLSKEFPLLTLRRIPLKIFIAEQVWFISGSNRTDDFLNRHTKIWDDFLESDGTIAAAYGYRWRKHFGRDQLAQLIFHLKAQPHSRHGVVMAWDPADDGLTGKGLIGTYKKNVPCPFCFIVNIINGRLYFHLIIRSSDTILGLPHDIAGASLLAYILAEKLNVKPGELVVSMTNAHVWDIHYDGARELLGRKINHDPIKFKAKSGYFERAEKKDDTLVEEIFQQLKSQYNPLDRIEGLKIVL